MISQLIPRIGFPWTMRAVAFMILGMLTIANLSLKSRLKHVPKPFRVMEFVSNYKEIRFALVSMASFFFFLGIFLPTNFIILQGQANGVSRTLSPYLLPILNATRYALPSSRNPCPVASPPLFSRSGTDSPITQHFRPHHIRPFLRRLRPLQRHASHHPRDGYPRPRPLAPVLGPRAPHRLRDPLRLHFRHVRRKHAGRRRANLRHPRHWRPQWHQLLLHLVRGADWKSDCRCSCCERSRWV